MNGERGTSIREVMNTIVPITRFNRGEASKIFDEVSSRGVKVVLKNNDPVCVLVEPERYEAMVEALEDYALYFEAERRAAKANGNAVSHADVMAELGIREEDLADVEVDIE